jgi:hypothetical protein
VSRRILSVAVVAVALLAAYGCGGGNGTDASVRSGGPGATVHAADGAVDGSAGGVRTVAYQGVQFDVPADWPVYDLAADPTTCVRFDVHAVYLGHPGADMSCPATIIGRAEAVLVEPTDGAAIASTGPVSSDVTAAAINGVQAQVADGGTVTNQLDATFPTAGVSATLTYQDSDTTAQQILQSFRAAGQ